MADERAKIDSNWRASGVVAGVTDNADLDIMQLRLDPTTKRLKVDAVITTFTGVTDGEAIDAADTGSLILGTDGTNYQIVSVDTSGRLILGASTLAIGKLAANSGVDIGDIDILSIAAGDNNIGNVDVVTMPTVAVTGTFWQATQPVSIAATVATDMADEATRLLGVVYGSQGAQLQQKVTTNDLIVTLDSESVAVTGTFWQATQPVSGTFWQATQPVSLASVPSHAVTNAGVFAVQVDGAALTSLQLIDDAIAGTEMQVDVVASLPAGTNAIGKLAANSGVDIGDIDILSIAAGDNNIGNVDILSIIPGTGATNLGKAIDSVGGATDTGVAPLAIRDDALGALTPIEGDYVALRTDANGALWVHDDALDAALAGSELQVDVVASLPAGTNGIGKLTANTGVDIGDVDVLTIPGIVGTIADDATTPGAPVMTGGTAKNFDGTDPGNISAEDDVTRFITDPNRRQYVNTVHPQMWSYHENSSSALTDASVQAAPAANYSIFVTDIIFSSGAATAINIFFEEGASTVLGPYYLEAIAGRGLSLHFTTPKKITAATALTVTTSAAIAHGLDVLGYIAKVT